MGDLSHWDYAQRFTGLELAALVMGLDPQGPGFDPKRVEPVLRDVEYAFKKRLLEPCDLAAVREGKIPLRLWNGVTGHIATDISEEYFIRKEVARWLRENGIKSAYRFDLDAPQLPPPTPEKATIPRTAGHWPWGDHHTELLGHLEAAALRFWVNYDPKDKSTAPTNDQICDWLRERGLSKNMAGAIATILRLDDLPNGPRT